MSAAFGAFITHESDSSPSLSGPAPVLHRDRIYAPAPTEYELRELQWGQRLNGPTKEQSQVISEPLDSSIPPTPGELEQSQPPTPYRAPTVDALLQSFSNPPKNRWRVASATVFFFLMGLNDAATGALIPYLERHYDIGYAVVSLIFVTNAVGWILMAPISQMIEHRVGRARSYIVATTLMSIGYIALVCAPPFPVVVLSFFVLGLGMALFLGMTNAFLVNLMNGTVILGFCHGIYGVGGVISPLVATAIVSRGVRWSYYYFIPLVISIMSIFFLGWSYRGYEDDAAVQLLTNLERTASRQAGEPTKFQLFKRALKSRTTLLGATFIFFYQGAEVAISGWVISYLIYYRKGDPSQVGNVTSGFWGGITVGRFVLTHFAHKMGERLAVFVLIAGAAAFQLLVWLVPNIIGNAVAEAIVGVFLGPVYPCAMAIFSKLLPRSIQIVSLSFAASMGSSGGAIVPLITGLMSQSLSTVVLHPIVLISFALMTVGWALLPRVGKRAE
ncbi:major facilitator superfamily domain-containing protein [Exophiala viscosa]|uniref:Major facilitator superfamily domain-containing protein n=1 Tax=Exophiala viscosa TaxID=2486360 RepID=A0AAN6DV01_9EURO|nr:major facilitator superfamily domain-containing protein [Exophiala viscosa]